MYSYNVCNIFLQEPHYLCMFCNLTEEMGYFWQCFILQYSRTLCSIPILYSSWGKNVLFLVVICNVTYTAVFYCSVECFAFCAGKVLKRSAFVSFPIIENLIPPPTPATSAIWPTTLLKIQFDPSPVYVSYLTYNTPSITVSSLLIHRYLSYLTYHTLRNTEGGPPQLP